MPSALTRQDPPARRRSLLPAIYISAALLILVSAVLLWYQSRPDQGTESKGSDSRSGTTPTPPEAPHSSAESGTKTDDSTGPVVPAHPETREIAPGEHSHRDTKSIAHNAPARDAVGVALTQGALHMDKGEYQEAIRTYQDALKIEPGNVELKQKIRAAQTAWEVEQRILKK